MTHLFFFIAEAFRALRRSAAPSLAAIVTVVLTTLLIGVFVPVIKASSTTNQNVRSELTLRVFMKQNATQKQAVAVQRKIDRSLTSSARSTSRRPKRSSSCAATSASGP